MCTRTLWNTDSRGAFVSRSMDWPTTTEPKLAVFPRGLARDGGVLGAQRVIEESQSLRWTSTHGSVVTTIFDLGAADGLNERGLGAHLLYFGSCDFGERRGDRPGVHAGLWVQLLLDTAATVSEALEVLDEVEFVMVAAHGSESRVHVALEDTDGDSAVIEYIAGEKKVYHGSEYVIMTNDPPYDEQLEFHAGFDLSEPTRDTPIPGNVNPRDRFVRAAYYCAALPEPANDREAVAGVLAIARNVSVPFGAPYKTVGTVYNTEYRTVCDLTNRRYFFELTTSPSVVWTDLSQFDLSAGATAVVLDPGDLALAGDVTQAFRVLDTVPF